MTQRREVDDNSGYRSQMVELVWYARLRWIAGAAILGAGAVSAASEAAGWAESWLVFVVLGVAVLGHNGGLAVALRSLRARRGGKRGPIALAAGSGVLLDLAALTCLVMTTGGLYSPAIGLFVLHMVFVSLLLPLRMSYVAAGVAVAMVAAGLASSGAFPRDVPDVLFGAGWAASLVLVAYMTDRIAGTLRRQERALAREQSRSMAILEAALDGIITITPSGTIVDANPSACRIFGREADGLVGARLSELVRCADGSAIGSALRGSGLLGGIQEMEGARSDGAWVPLEVGFSEVRIGGSRLYTGVVRDISVRKSAEAELKQLNERLRRQQHALVQQEKMTALGQMTAGVVHEIANPLSNMDSVLQLAARNPDALTAETAASLREQVKRIHHILKQMTNFAHPDQSGSERVDVDEMVEGALAFVGFDKRLKRVEMERALGCEGGRVELNPHALQQVMVNLITNALDALEGCEGARLTVRTRCVDGRAMIEVEDTGCGIPEEALERVFDPFFTTKPVGHGTGLGLSISYRLVEQMGGQIGVESREGEWTRFRIELPLIAEEVSLNRENPRGGSSR